MRTYLDCIPCFLWQMLDALLVARGIACPAGSLVLTGRPGTKDREGAAVGAGLPMVAATPGRAQAVAPQRREPEPLGFSGVDV